MTTFNTDAIYKIFRAAKGKDSELGNLYLKSVPVTFAQVHKAAKKYNSEERAWQANVFINKDTLAKLEVIGLNKELAEVGVTKIKKGTNRGNLKYKLDQHNTPYVGMFGTQFERATHKRNGDENTPLKVVSVVDGKGVPFTQDVGNGSVCDIKLFAYRNEENMLVVMLDTIVVLEHVPYLRDGEYFDEELGISIKAPESPVKDDTDELDLDLLGDGGVPENEAQEDSASEEEVVDQYGNEDF